VDYLEKVIHWSFLFYPHLGGLSTHISSIVNNTQEFEHEVVTNRIPNTPLIEKYSANTTIKRFNPPDIYHFPEKRMRRRYSIPYGAYSEVLRTYNQKNYFRKSCFDVLHVHETNKNLVTVDMALGTNLFSKISLKMYDLRKLRKPLLLTKHSLMVDGHHHPKLIEWDYKLTSQFDNIICVDRRIYDSLTSYFESTNQKKKLHLIPNGIDLHKFTYADPVYGDKLKVGIAGRLSYETGQNFIAEFLQFLPEFVEVHWACSENNLRIENLKSSVNNSAVHIYPNVNYDSMPDFYHNIDVLLNPLEFTYNVSRVTLESMACGRPVIMFPGSRYPLIHGENGVIVEKDIGALISLMSELAFDRIQLYTMGKESRRIIEKEFATEILIPKIGQIYRKLSDN
jgi:glycosyltransferase involved in cell wall biosynthesis